MPPKEKKALTPEEKYKLELQTEAELLRLQRQYVILERDKAAFGMSGDIAKQKKVINILKREYNEIVTDLDVAGSNTNAKQDSRVAENLQKLLNEHNLFVTDIKRETCFLAEIETQIVMAKKNIVQLRSQCMTDVQTTQRIMEGQRTLEALENKLEMATKRFCTTLAKNRKLRDEIDHLLKERAHFNKLWDKLVMNLSQGKKFMLDLIEQASISYDQREEWCQKLASLRARANSEYLAHTQEMTDMQHHIDHEKKLQEFLAVKGQRRVMVALMEKEAKRRQEQCQEMEETLSKYQALLQEITDFMEQPNIHLVAEKFAETEMENFSMFQYVMGLNKELEVLGDRAMELRLNIDMQRRQRELREEQQTEKLALLGSELERLQNETQTATNELQATEVTINKLMEGIEKLFAMCKCSNTPLLELLGNNSSINTSNVLLYLEILEKRINELMVSAYYKEAKKTNRKSAPFKDDRAKPPMVSVEEMVPKDTCPLCVEQALVSDVIDSLQKVLDKEQIKAKLDEAIEKRNFSEVVHNVSGCHLPKSRAIIQRRYQ